MLQVTPSTSRQNRELKLKLQMQITADGFVAGPEGQLDWMTWNMDEKLQGFITHLTDTSDTILLGRKMTPGFIDYWEREITKPQGPQYPFARKMVELPKVVFSKTRCASSMGKTRAWKIATSRMLWTNLSRFLTTTLLCTAAQRSSLR